MQKDPCGLAGQSSSLLQHFAIVNSKGVKSVANEFALHVTNFIIHFHTFNCWSRYEEHSYPELQDVWWENAENWRGNKATLSASSQRIMWIRVLPLLSRIHHIWSQSAGQKGRMHGEGEWEGRKGGMNEMGTSVTRLFLVVLILTGAERCWNVSSTLQSASTQMFNIPPRKHPQNHLLT